MAKAKSSPFKCPQCGHEWKAELDAIDYAAAGDVIAVFEHHCEVMSDDPRHPRTWKLTRQLRTHIQCRLQDFTAEQLMEAADKLSRSDWHRGRDPRNNKEFCEPAFLYRSDIQVDKWLNMKELPIVAPADSVADLAPFKPMMRPKNPPTEADRREYSKAIGKLMRRHQKGVSEI